MDKIVKTLFTYLPRIRILNLYVLNKYKNITTKISPICVKEINYDNIKDVLSFKSHKVVAKFAKLLTNENYKGFYVYYNNIVIAHGWVCINTSYKSIMHNRYFRVNPQDALIFNCAVSPNFRCKNIYQYLLSSIYSEMKSHINGKLWIDTEKNNIPANKAIIGVGATYIEKIYLLKLRSRTIIRLK